MALAGGPWRWRSAALSVAAIAVATLIAGAWGIAKLVTSGPGQPWAGGRVGRTVLVGGAPGSLAVDEPLGTVYAVLAGSGTFSLVNAATCNATATAGCAGARHEPAGGGHGVAVAVNAGTHTIYVANGPAKTVTVINAATCNAMNTSGCSAGLGIIRFGGAPQSLTVDPRTDTMYAGVLTGRFREVAVVNGATCNATDTRGCGTVIATVPLGPGLHQAVTVDPATDAVYASAAGKLTVIDGRTCDGTDVTGCAKPAATIGVYGYITGLATATARTVYATSPGTGTVTAVNPNACGASRGCVPAARLIRAGADPAGAVDDPAERTLYVTNQVLNTVSMIDTDTCQATGSSGCPEFPVAFPVGTAPDAAVLDSTAHTVYVANFGAGTLSVIGTETCNAMDAQGCPGKSPAGTTGLSQTPYACNQAVAAYASGEPAGHPVSASVRVASGSVGDLSWTLWATKEVSDPNAIEQGGLVIDDRWYPLCSRPLSTGADGSTQVIDTPGNGIVYGYIQHSAPVDIRLTADGKLLPPYSILLPGMTFFIEQLPASACSYRVITLQARQGVSWSGSSNLTLGACAPGKPVVIAEGNSAWGPGAGN